MLENYELHNLVRNTCDDRFGDVPVDTRSAFGPVKYRYGRAYPWYRSSFGKEVVRLTFPADVATLPVPNLRIDGGPGSKTPGYCTVG